jgi:hypothetical protein
VLGDDHPDTLTTANNLAIDLRELGDVEGAEDLARQVAQGRIERWPLHDPDD